MRLARLLDSAHTLPTTDKLAFAILKRLSIVEAMIGLSIEYLPPKDDILDSSSREILSAVEALELLIRNAIKANNKQLSKTAIKTDALSSAHHVLPSFKKDHEVNDKIKAYIDRYTQQIVDKTKTCQQVNPFHKVQEMLISAYPAINQERLNTIILNMNQVVNTNEDDWVIPDSIQEPLEGLSFFKARTESNPEPKSNGCVIA